MDRFTPSRPPGPPPYSVEQLAELSSPVDVFRASAELNSYIKGHQLADERESHVREESLTPEGDLFVPQMDGSNDPSYADGSGGDFQPAEQHTPTVSHVNDYQGFSASSTGPIRNGGNIHPTQRNAFSVLDVNGQQNFIAPHTGPIRNNHCRGRGRGAIRGYPNYHPYQFQQPRGRYTNRFNPYPLHGHMFATSPRPHVNHCEVSGRYGQIMKSDILCPAFTSTGRCNRSQCPNVHDEKKQALCKAFLFKNNCTYGDACDLSHERNHNNTPHCRYHREGRCTNSNCSFVHSEIDNTGRVCESFARVGYCENGGQCPDLHAFICPALANEGSCAAGKSCRFKHVRHALRSQAASRRPSDSGVPLGNSGASLILHTPDAANALFDPDTNSVQDTINGSNSPAESHAITLQHDYIPFGPEN
ncbi:hypothetical protein K458DRAFT_419421 [Lentithecium fluviatile CBS 122367]|uniref:C3H1-type domain-containing protein n=1 Tax=Lentithecium fluviatile CBS 122367 TaxID=1168545 RepID=A0A6G1IWS6_9PLEO|nr:hypothetical protein K458DRAFT_419421 [Lentithecium fluviatile CBS 122367]